MRALKDDYKLLILNKKDGVKWLYLGKLRPWFYLLNIGVVRYTWLSHRSN